MTLNLRAALRAAVLLLLLPFAARAADTDYSDLWWNPAESGWGVGLQRQGDVIFLTLFVYGADGASTWFVASSVQAAEAGGTRWQGPLHRTSGPAFASAYDGNVQSVPVGNVTLDFDGPSAGTLTYTVDGVRVTKAITRMTFREPSAGGRFYGGFTAAVGSECVDPTRVGDYEFLGNMTVTHTDRQARVAVTAESTGGTSTCTFSATTSQSGRMGTWTGTFNCSIFIGLDGRGENVVRVLRAGTFSLDEVTITSTGFHGSLTAADQDCAFRGRLGGTRIP